MADLIDWCEAWAKARAYWTHSAHRRKGWCVRAIDAAHLPPGFQVCRGGDDGFDGWTSLTPVQMWLFAHAVDSGRTDSQRCPDCEGSKIKTVIRTNPGPRCTVDAAATNLEWSVVLAVDFDGVTTRTISRPCPTCTGPAVECEACDGKGGWQRASSWDGCRACDSMRTVPGPPLGYISRPLARVVCEAMPCDDCEGTGESHPYSRDDDDDPGYRPDCDECSGTGGRDPAARLALGFHLDALQAEGDPLGQALALWLHGVPCETCSGTGDDPPKYWNGYEDPTCDACHGDGTALGAYVAAQLEAAVVAQWRADCDDLELSTMEDLAADFLDALAP